MKPRSELAELLEMLTYCRPAGTGTEYAFIQRYIASLPGAVEDCFHNWHVKIGESPILWSCHTDTVHRKGGRQTVHYDPQTQIVCLSKRAKQTSSCLGADDTAGVFLCRALILAGVPGHYVFHAEEETGGVGSTELANTLPELISSSRFAIALDRSGFFDVITHQAGSRCCSDAFARSLASQLNATNDPQIDFQLCDRGIFTDTANYTDLIGECTNLSVGYFKAHTTDERLYTGFVLTLLEALKQIDPSTLVDKRPAGDPDDRWISRWNGGRSSSPLVVIDRAEPPIRVWHVCDYCGDVYEENESTADDFDHYCSLDCETDDDEAQQRHLPYLDPVYEEVQNALRELTPDDDETADDEEIH